MVVLSAKPKCRATTEGVEVKAEYYRFITICCMFELKYLCGLPLSTHESFMFYPGAHSTKA